MPATDARRIRRHESVKRHGQVRHPRREDHRRFGQRRQLDDQSATGIAIIQGQTQQSIHGAAAALGAITAGAKECADAAGNLQQSVGGVETVFGSSSDKMLKWSQNASQAVGLSQNSYNELATLMG
jgi:hypothetical protein